ncbi:MAG: hypothetical protein HOV80_15840 [Polyangiaceae bacterium]|nr:hypothetical protein [Polyangiaceae bacterium]
MASVALAIVGCLPTAPDVPSETPKLEIPQAPEVPSFEPPAKPELAAPDAPQVPLPPGQGGGNCCIRTGVLLETKCGGAASCCVKAIESMGDCEDAKGLWFFEEEGCAGAC